MVGLRASTRGTEREERYQASVLGVISFLGLQGQVSLLVAKNNGLSL